MQGHYLNQCWQTLHWTLGNKLQWYFNRHSNISIQEKASEYAVCEMAAILSRLQCVNCCHGEPHWPPKTTASHLCYKNVLKSFAVNKAWVMSFIDGLTLLGTKASADNTVSWSPDSNSAWTWHLDLKSYLMVSTYMYLVPYLAHLMIHKDGMSSWVMKYLQIHVDNSRDSIQVVWFTSDNVSSLKQS